MKQDLRIVINEATRIEDPVTVGRTIRALWVGVAAMAVGVGYQMLTTWLASAPLNWKLTVLNALGAGGGGGALYHLIPKPVKEEVQKMQQSSVTITDSSSAPDPRSGSETEIHIKEN